jgi:DNA polymerase III delta subunit
MEELTSDIDMVIDAITNGDIEDAVKLLEEIKLSVK